MTRLPRVGLRGVQLLGALSALVALLTSFPTTSRFRRTNMLGSMTTTFSLLVVYTALLFSLLLLLVTKTGTCTNSLTLITLLWYGDLLLALLLLVAGGLLVTSDYVVHCDLYGSAIDCSRLQTAATSVFITHAAFVGAAMLSRKPHKHDYQEVMTEEETEDVLAKSHHD